MTESQNMIFFVKRELEVAALVASEMSDRQIAQKLGVSERTVRNYIRSACDKFEVETRVGLAVSYVKHFSKSA